MIDGVKPHVVRRPIGKRKYRRLVKTLQTNPEDQKRLKTQSRNGAKGKRGRMPSDHRISLRRRDFALKKSFLLRIARQLVKRILTLFVAGMRCEWLRCCDDQ